MDFALLAGGVALFALLGLYARWLKGV